MARILIVDDEPDVRELFNITLKMAGHVTETAKHGLEAVDRLQSDLPELIVLDLMMPHLDGFGLLNHIRNEMSTKPIRVLVATAKVLEDADQEKLGSWPVVGILNKGELDIGQMVLIVSSALTRNPLKDGAAAAAPKDQVTKDAPAAPAKDASPASAAKDTPAVPPTKDAPAVPAAKEAPKDAPAAAAAKDTAAPPSAPTTPGTPASPAAPATPSTPAAKDGPAGQTVKDGPSSPGSQ